jgi:hypothetical protein
MARTKREEALRQLAEAAAKGMAEVSPLSRMELEVEESKRVLGQEQMDAKLASLPPENKRPKACPRCGQNARLRAANVPRTFKSLSGTHTISRNYHYCEACKEGFYPRDEFLGLPREGELSSELEKRVADFAVNDPYDVAEERWSFHYRLPLSSNQFRQVAKRLGQQVEESNELILQGGALAPEPTPSRTLYVMLDGSMVPMRGEWNEAKVAVLFRAENHLSHRVARRGYVSRARYVASLGGQERFKEELDAALKLENAVGAKRVVWVGDGAPGNWRLASSLCPKAFQVLDWCHAIGHGVDCGKALLGETDIALSAWKQRIEHLLMAGDVEALLEEVRACRAEADEAGREAIDKLLRYYEGNASRIGYADFLRQGLLISSGIVESAHRHVLQIRMKRAGQHWSLKGGRQMARLRAVYRTAGPEHFYAAVRWAHRASARTRNLIPKPFKADLRTRAFSQR